MLGLGAATVPMAPLVLSSGEPFSGSIGGAPCGGVSLTLGVCGKPGENGLRGVG